MVITNIHLPKLIRPHSLEFLFGYGSILVSISLKNIINSLVKLISHKLYPLRYLFNRHEIHWKHVQWQDRHNCYVWNTCGIKKSHWNKKHPNIQKDPNVHHSGSCSWCSICNIHWSRKFVWALIWYLGCFSWWFTLNIDGC